jgi:two-component system sensor histidine kinase DesK
MAMSRTHRPVTAFGALVPGSWIAGTRARPDGTADTADPRSWPTREDITGMAAPMPTGSGTAAPMPAGSGMAVPVSAGNGAAVRVGARRMAGPVVSLLGLVLAVAGMLTRSTVAHPAAVVIDACLLGAGYVAALYAGPNAGRAVRVAMLAVLLALAAGFAVIIGDPHTLGLVSYPIIVSVVLLPVLWTRVLGTVAAVAALAASWRLSGTPNWDVALLLAFIAYVLTGIRQLSRTITELRAARDEIAELSVAAERTRVARDLHDVLGHSLTTITVKTGLARRVLENGADTARAITEVRDAERLSRETLDEIRATVSGYRRASLPAELAGARAALRAAGITAHLPQSADEVHPALREPFAHTLREATTNIIRHSQATTCEVRLTPTSIEIHNNAPAPAAPAPAAPAPAAPAPAAPAPAAPAPAAPATPVPATPTRTPTPTPGSGLGGLAERMAAVGGRLEYGPLPGGGFRLRAEAVNPGRTEGGA